MCEYKSVSGMVYKSEPSSIYEFVQWRDSQASHAQNRSKKNMIHVMQIFTLASHAQNRETYDTHLRNIPNSVKCTGYKKLLGLLSLSYIAT